MPPTKFVLLASPRTGSNALNEALNQYQGVVMHGEVFNEAFVGLRSDYHRRWGIGREAVDARDKETLLSLIYADPDAACAGFHLFPRQDDELCMTLVADPTVKKVALRRTYFPAYVSLQIARQTDRWLETVEDANRATPKATFSSETFEAYRNYVDRFWWKVAKTAKASGEKVYDFYFSQVNDLDALNSLADFLGVPRRDAPVDRRLKRQNPEPLWEKVENWDEMRAYAVEHGLDQHLY